MPDENPIRSAVDRGGALERDILYLLTEPDDGQPLWSVEDIAREVEADEPMVLVRGLLRAGLIYQTSDGFVFATRAGWRIVQMIGQVV